MFCLLNSRWQCCPGKSRVGRGSPGPAGHLRDWVPGGLSVSSICLPLAHELPFSPLSFVRSLPRLPWNVFPCLFFPTRTVPVGEGISTRLLSLTHPSFGNKHGHWWPGPRKLSGLSPATWEADLPEVQCPGCDPEKEPSGPRGKHLSKQNRVSGSRRWPRVRKTCFGIFYFIYFFKYSPEDTFLLIFRGRGREREKLRGERETSSSCFPHTL